MCYNLLKIILASLRLLLLLPFVKNVIVFSPTLNFSLNYVVRLCMHWIRVILVDFRTDV